MADTIVAAQDLKDFQLINSGTSGTYPQGRFALVFQQDGNLVLYLQEGGGVIPPTRQALWASNTNGGGGQRCPMQDDGNLVIYDGRNNPVWASGTNGNPGAYGKMQDDGNFVIYDSGDNPLWATGTNR